MTFAERQTKNSRRGYERIENEDLKIGTTWHCERNYMYKERAFCLGNSLCVGFWKRMRTHVACAGDECRVNTDIDMGT